MSIKGQQSTRCAIDLPAACQQRGHFGDAAAGCMLNALAEFYNGLPYLYPRWLQAVADTRQLLSYYFVCVRS